MCNNCVTCIGILDPIKISYKLTTNVSVTYYRIHTIPVNTTYNSNYKSKFMNLYFKSNINIFIFQVRPQEINCVIVI